MSTERNGVTEKQANAQDEALYEVHHIGDTYAVRMRGHSKDLFLSNNQHVAGTARDALEWRDDGKRPLDPALECPREHLLAVLLNAGPDAKVAPWTDAVGIVRKIRHAIFVNSREFFLERFTDMGDAAPTNDVRVLRPDYLPECHCEKCLTGWVLNTVRQTVATLLSWAMPKITPNGFDKEAWATKMREMPLVRTGPGGDFTKDYTPEVFDSCQANRVADAVMAAVAVPTGVALPFMGYTDGPLQTVFHTKDTPAEVQELHDIARMIAQITLVQNREMGGSTPSASR